MKLRKKSRLEDNSKTSTIIIIGPSDLWSIAYYRWVRAILLWVPIYCIGTHNSIALTHRNGLSEKTRLRFIAQTQFWPIKSISYLPNKFSKFLINKVTCICCTVISVTHVHQLDSKKDLSMRIGGSGFIAGISSVDCSACLTPDLRVVSLKFGWGEIPFRRILASHLWIMWEKKESCVNTGVRKPGNTCASPTTVIMTLAVKVALNLNTTNKLHYVLVPYLPTILKIVLCLIIQIHLYLETVESNTTSDRLNGMV